MITSVIETTLLFSCTNISWLFLHNVSYCFGNCEFLGRGNGHKYYLPFSLSLLSPLPVPAYFNSVNSAFQQPTYTPTQFVSKLNASGGTGGGEGAEQDLKGRQAVRIAQCSGLVLPSSSRMLALQTLRTLCADGCQGFRWKLYIYLFYANWGKYSFFPQPNSFIAVSIYCTTEKFSGNNKTLFRLLRK